MSRFRSVFLASSLTAFVIGGTTCAAAKAFVRKSDITDDLLIAKRAEEYITSNPNSNVTVDLYEIYLKCPNETLDTYVESFIGSSLFSLERWILKLSKIIETDDGTPDEYPVGRAVGMWKVSDRNDSNGELIFDWSTPSFPFAGSTYFRIRRLNKVAMKLQFGSITSGPTMEGRSPIAMEFHDIYSRLLLIAASIRLISK